jgi:hypothetical protein
VQRFTGWLWRENHWESVCTGESLQECARRLEEQGRQLKVPGHFQVMTTGGPPAFTPKEES